MDNPGIRPRRDVPFGIVLGHWLLHAPFTATSMIGFIALAGIIVRNSILFVDFIRRRRGEGAVLLVALLEAGAIRFKPIFLTAAAAMIGAAFIRANVGVISMNADRGPICQRVLYLMNIAIAGDTAVTSPGTKRTSPPGVRRPPGPCT